MSDFLKNELAKVFAIVINPENPEATEASLRQMAKDAGLPYDDVAEIGGARDQALFAFGVMLGRAMERELSTPLPKGLRGDDFVGEISAVCPKCEGDIRTDVFRSNLEIGVERWFDLLEGNEPVGRCEVVCPRCGYTSEAVIMKSDLSPRLVLGGR